MQAETGPDVATDGDSPAGKPDAELHVSSRELFFDIVFVFTITQLTSLLARQLSLTGAVQVFLIFVVLFWMYGGYAWLTNQVPPVSTSWRLLLIAGMAAFFVCALAIPRAFADAGLAFGVGYLLVVLVHSGLYAQVHGRVVLRFVRSDRRRPVCGARSATPAGNHLGPSWLTIFAPVRAHLRSHSPPRGAAHVSALCTRVCLPGKDHDMRSAGSTT
jgi:hypothetical protein